MATEHPPKNVAQSSGSSEPSVSTKHQPLLQEQNIETPAGTTSHAAEILEAQLQEEEWKERHNPARFSAQSNGPSQANATKEVDRNQNRKESVSEAAERLEAKLLEDEWHDRGRVW